MAAASSRLSTLPNGIRVLSDARPGARSVALLMLVAAAPIDERPPEAGASHFVEHMLFRGSAGRSALALQRLIDGLGGAFFAESRRSVTAYQAQVMAADLPRALEALSEMVRAPRWSGLDTERRILLEELAEAEEDPADRADVLLDAAIFGAAHPHGRPILGRPGTLNRLGRAELAAYHARTYVGRRIAVAACGAVEHGELVGALAAGLGRLAPGRARARRAPPRPRPARGPRFVPVEGGQCHLMLGVEAPAEDDPRLEALARLDLILGGLEGSRLIQAIRERRGLAYAVWSELEPGWGAGRAAIYAATQADNVAACLALVAAVLAELRAGRIGRGEWQAAERAALARLALDWDQPAHWVWHQLPRVLRGEPPRGFEEALTGLRAVARDQMGALARAVWAPRRLRAVGVGPDRRSFLRAAEGLIGSTDEGRRPRG